jgi:hypothetical protein
MSMAYVFISYCRESQSVVKALADDIGGLGHKVWMDQQLSGGQAWWDQILGAIRECDVFVSALAPESLDSAACKLEYKYASALGKTVLPVLVADGVSVNLLPAELSRIQHVDYRRQDKQAAIGVLKALAGLPVSPALPNPLPEPPPPPLSYLGGLMEQIETSGVLSFQDQAALVLKLKERLAGGEHRDEVRKLLGRLRDRDDLYARIGEEIDTLVTPQARAQPSNGSAQAAGFAGAAPNDARRTTSQSASSSPRAVPTSRSKGWSILRALGALICALGPAVGTVEGMIEARVLNASAGFPAFVLFLAIWVVAMWFLIPLVARSLKRRRNAV